MKFDDCQAMSKIKVEQNVRSSVAAVMDSLGRKTPIEYGSSTIRPSEQANGGAYKNKLTFTSDSYRNNHASDSKLQHDSSETDGIPFELIVSCVATYHMIQVSHILQFSCDGAYYLCWIISRCAYFDPSVYECIFLIMFDL